jgi:hypothetical protein
MRRLLGLFFLLLLIQPPLAEAQRVRLTITDTVDARGRRVPLIFTPSILRDERWLETVQNSFPLRMEFRVEIWRVRTDWFDALERAFEWGIIIQFEPLTDQYTKSEEWGGALRRETTFGSLPELERNLELGQQVSITPAGTGEYYFTATLRLRTLSDDEMEELERFLQGNPDPVERERGSVFSRAMRRLVARLGGLPFDQLEARSRRFNVPLRPGEE